MATILTKKSDTASAVPLAADLTNAAGGAELAVNATDKRLFSKTSGGTVVELGTNPTAMAVVGNTTVGGTLGVTGATTLAGVSATTLSASSTVTLSGGTANGVAYLNGSKVVTSGSALTFDGTDLATTGGVRLNNSQYYYGKNAAGSAVRLLGINSGNVNYIGAIDSGPTEVNFGAASSITSQYWNISGSEGMRLTSTGLGIGTSSPDRKLSIYTTDSAGKMALFSNGNTNTNLYLSSDPSSGGGVINVSNNAASAALPLLFQGNGTTRLTLDSSGNLGLGVTPKTWGSYFKALQMGDYAAFANNVQDASAIVSSNAYNNDNTNWRYSFSSVAASRYEVSAGAFRWFNAPSGTAGNAITFTQALTLNASGQLLVGTTSAAGSERLNIVGGTGIRVNEDGVGTKILTIRSDYAGLGPAINVTTNDPLLFLTNNTERARIDSSGNLGIGTTTPSSRLTVSNSSGGNVAAFTDTSSADLNINLTAGVTLLTPSTGTLAFGTSSTERARIDSSGNLLINTTSSGSLPGDGYVFIKNTSTQYTGHASGTASGTGYQQFWYNGASIGSITQNGTTGVLYNLTSDYRLKNNPIALTGSGEFIDALQPKTWDWHDGSGKGVGFIAHEFMEVAKYSGNGEKDAVDSDGKPIYQSIQPSSSEVMAYLVAEIQSLRKRLADAGL